MIGSRFLSGCSLLVTLFLTYGIATPASASDSDEAKPFAIKHAEWRAEYQELRVNGEGRSGAEVTISYASSGDFIASARINNDGKWQVRVTQINPVPCRVRGESNGASDERDVEQAPPDCDQTPVMGGEFTVLAANDLGMHCADQDYQIFSILPPFNVVHAQVIRRGTATSSPQLVVPGVDTTLEVFYSAAANPSDPVFLDPLNPPSPLVDPARAAVSINTTSQNDPLTAIFKTNFWDINANTGNPFGFDAYQKLFFGLLSPTDVRPDVGLPVPDSVLLNPLDLCLADLTACLGQQEMPGIDNPYVDNVPKAFDRFDHDFNFFSGVLPPPLGSVVTDVNWYAADGIPIMPIDDAGRVNAYPLMRIEAADQGVSLASVDLVLPVAAEADCQNCHATAIDCADPRLPERIRSEECNESAVSPTQFSNTSFEVATIDDAPGDTIEQQLYNAAKINVLRLHDAKHGDAYTNVAGDATPCDVAADPLDPDCIINQTPVQCSQCHYSPALDLAQLGPTDDPGVEVQQRRHITQSRAMHYHHGQFTELFPAMPAPNDPARTPELVEQVLEQTCYQCHPGKRTQCLRGAMFAGGVVCQDCHGDMQQVGNDFSGNLSLATPFPDGADLTKRVPWASEPQCQSCHIGDAVTVAAMDLSDFIVADDGIRLLQTYTVSDANDQNLAFITSPDSRFAEEESLYRLSKGHAGIMCEACHGSTHAIWPIANPDANDNIAAVQLQGHSGTVIECSACHAPDSLGLTLDGPHGMHPVGDPLWNDKHEELAKSNPDACRACHGLNGEGTVLSRMATTRTLKCEDKNLPDCNDNEQITLTKGTEVSCTLCHDNEL